MSRITNLFEQKKQRVLNVYFTAGYPALNDTLTVMRSLASAGADLIEIGMPYSDPLADGPVIQDSSSKALANGMTIQTLFEQLKGFRKDPLLAKTGVVLMGYMNPVLQYGFEKFCAAAAEAGVDGLILPDLPEYEFENEFGVIIKKYGLDFVFLVTPETTNARIHQLDRLSSGFLYAVSSSATTGGNTNFAAVEVYLQKLQQMKLNNPVLVGFGIRDRASFDSACTYANGAIIGSAYIKALANVTDIDAATKAFVKPIIQAK
ncbi:MAG: tryptophan synthase subunit alpha [Sphingobacteriia bacterium]|nr:tryptophan synthase subunit alpha [Sphingobacteriia bacterium]